MKRWPSNPIIVGMLCGLLIAQPAALVAQEANDVAGGASAGVGASAGEAGGSRVRVAELSKQAETAIDSGLKYIASQQNDNGAFGSAGITSLALMAFMLKGYFPDPDRDEDYGKQLDKAVQYLINKAKANGGYFGGNMYHHGLGTLALSEVWGMSQRDDIREVLKANVEVILRAQNQRGGWRYDPRPVPADISVTVMQVVALTSAKEAGIHVPKESIDRAIKYVKSLHTKEGGFGYTNSRGPGFARTAAGVLSLQMCGERNSKEVVQGLKYLFNEPDSIFTTEERHFYYGHYYAMQAMYQAGETHYNAWYPRIHDVLIKLQRKDGSWPGRHGEVYCTSMAILVLGVPYRYLPIYQR